MKINVGPLTLPEGGLKIQFPRGPDTAEPRCSTGVITRFGTADLFFTYLGRLLFFRVPAVGGQRFSDGTAADQRMRVRKKRAISSQLVCLEQSRRVKD